MMEKNWANNTASDTNKNEQIWKLYVLIEIRKKYLPNRKCHDS